MEALVPLTVVLACAAATLLALASTLRSQEREADEAAHRLGEKRRAILAASKAYLHALGADAPPSSEAARAERLLAEAAREEDLGSAARLDDELLDRLESLYRAQQSTSPRIDQAHALLIEAHSDASQAREIYNNRATTCNNAACSFPLVLVARRSRFARKPSYAPRKAAGARDSAQHATQETLAEETRVMNAYMLWAVSLSGATLEEDRETAR